MKGLVSREAVAIAAVAALVASQCGSGSAGTGGGCKSPKATVTVIGSSGGVGDAGQPKGGAGGSGRGIPLPGESVGSAAPGPGGGGAAPAPGTAGLSLQKVAACFFAGPYEYMFQSYPGTGGALKAIQVMGKSYGVFMGGINGILHYGSLTDCMATELGVAKSSYSDLGPVEKASGLPVYGPGMDYSKPFGWYNPDIVVWGYENLIPDPGMKIDGVVTAQAVYDVVLKRFFRMMAESYLWLVDSGKYQKEQDSYMLMATGQAKTQDGIQYLQDKYAGKLPQYQCAWDYTSMTPQMAIGFWLRRGVDGTSDELWTGLRKGLGLYDATWLASLKATYPSTAITW